MTDEERAAIRAIAEVDKQREAGAITIDEAIRRIGEIVAKDDARKYNPRSASHRRSKKG
jgi:hypothetical protein